MPAFELAALFGAGKILGNNVDDILDGAGDLVDQLSDETKELLATVRGEVDGLLDQVSDTFQDNLNYAVDELDTFTSNKISEVANLIGDVNDYVEDTVNLVSSSAEEILKSFQQKLNQTIKEIEKTLSNLIFEVGQTATFVLHRATYNVLTVTSWGLLGVGLIVIIVTLARNGIPSGLGGILFLILMGLFVGLFGAISLIPNFRKWVMKYTGLGLSGELKQREATPHIFRIDPMVIKLGKTLELEVMGYDLLHKDAQPNVEIGGQAVGIKAFSNEKIVVDVSKLSIPVGSSNLTFQYPELPEIHNIVRIEKEELPDLRIVSAQFTSPVVRAKVKTGFSVVVQNFGKKAVESCQVTWKPTASHPGFTKNINRLGEYENNDTETIEFEHAYGDPGNIVSIAELDARIKIEESNENNNRVSLSKRVEPLLFNVSVEWISRDFYLNGKQFNRPNFQLRLRPQTQSNWSKIDFSSHQKFTRFRNLIPGIKIALEGVVTFIIFSTPSSVVFEFDEEIELPDSAKTGVYTKTLSILKSSTEKGNRITRKLEYNIKYTVEIEGIGITTTHQDGSLLRDPSGAIYVIYGGAKFHIPSMDVFNGLKFDAGQVRQVGEGNTANIPNIPHDGTVLREMSSDPVYIMKEGKKQWVTDTKVLERYGGWDVVKEVPDGALKSIADGPQAT